MEILDNQLAGEPENTGLQINRSMRLNWLAISKWALFFAILGFILAGISLLSIGVVMPMMHSLLIMSGNYEAAAMAQSISAIVITVMVLATIVLFFVHYFHFRFAKDIQKAMQLDDQTTFEKAWRNLRYNFRLTGIIVISYLVIYLVGILFVIGLAANKSEF